MEKYFKTLSHDVQVSILNKVYYSQPKELLEDIKDFVKYKHYIANYVIDDATLVRDLFFYYNDNYLYGQPKAIVPEFTYNNIQKMKRLFIINNNESKYFQYYQYLCFHDMYSDNNFSKLINRYLGCLTPKERKEFFENTYFV